MKKILISAVGLAALVAAGSASAQCPGTGACAPTTQTYSYHETIPAQTWVVPAHSRVVPAYKISRPPTGTLVSPCPGAVGAGLDVDVDADFDIDLPDTFGAAAFTGARGGLGSGRTLRAMVR
jgi:hypothetical protein